MEKKVFKFYQDIKVSIWQRTHFTIKAENEQTAREIAKNLANCDISSDMDTDGLELQESEFLYETQENLTPEDNGGCTTIEVYESKGKYDTLIAENANGNLSLC